MTSKTAITINFDSINSGRAVWPVYTSNFQSITLISFSLQVSPTFIFPMMFAFSFTILTPLIPFQLSQGRPCHVSILLIVFLQINCLSRLTAIQFNSQSIHFEFSGFFLLPPFSGYVKNLQFPLAFPPVTDPTFICFLRF